MANLIVPAPASNECSLGRLSLTKAGIGQRDRLVLSLCQEAGVPVAVTMAGGYGKDLAEMVGIQLQTVKIAATFSHS
ncbi:MAG: hypothetical protein GY943_36220 [Chloroflexi bacterium]|nr:hypothetical protein [Chloroflexota bacterium]